jgi:hypothetical protein
MAVMADLGPIAQRYLRFAADEAHGSSPTFEAWSLAVAGDPAVLSRLAGLPAAKQQPNLVFAALRWHGAIPGDAATLRETLLGNWDGVAATILRRSTQTNEPGRCAVLLPLLHRIPGPLALIELGAAAGLCLIPDRYGYEYSDGTTVGPERPDAPILRPRITPRGMLPADLALPHIAWRAGLDLNPLDPADPDTAAWLTMLIWPEHEHRRQRLTAALSLAAAERARIDKGDLRTGLREQLTALITEAPAGTTAVVVHSATLAYLTDADRAAAATAITDTGARWISFEGRGVIHLTRDVAGPVTPDTLFAAALDREPLALASGHADAITVLDQPKGRH